MDGGDRNEEGRERPEPREGTARRGNVDGGGGKKYKRHLSIMCSIGGST